MTILIIIINFVDLKLLYIITRSTYAHHASRQILENSMNNHVKGVDVEVIKVIQL